MEIYLIKEEILETKLRLCRIQLKKNSVVKEQQYEEAAHLREQEKEIREHLEKLKRLVLKSLNTLKAANGSISDYVLLQNLLLEFQPIDLI